MSSLIPAEEELASIFHQIVLRQFEFCARILPDGEKYNCYCYIVLCTLLLPTHPSVAVLSVCCV